jgi:hypothetical protein
MIREGGAVAVQVFVGLGADPDRLRQQVIPLQPVTAGRGAVRASSLMSDRARAWRSMTSSARWVLSTMDCQQLSAGWA